MDIASRGGQPIRRTRQLVVAATFSIAVFACAPDLQAEASDAPGGAVTVVLDDIRFKPAEVAVSATEPTTLHLINQGGIVHDLVTDHVDSGAIRPGRAATVQIAPISEPVVAWCSVPGHRDAGMELVLVPAA